MMQDILYAARVLKKAPGFTVAVVFILAVGIGANSAVFTVARAALFGGFPLVKSNDRLLYITSMPGCCVSYPDFLDWKAQSRSFEDMALVQGTQASLTDGAGLAEMLQITEVTPNTFALTGHRPILGRDFTAGDAVPGTAPVAILSHEFWQARYGKDPGIVGGAIRLNGALTAIAGVMPEGYSFPQRQALWVPMVALPSTQVRDNREKWLAFGRLRLGATAAMARAEMDTIGKRLSAAYPASNQNFPPRVSSFRQMFIGANEAVIYETLWGAVGFVLLIGCANLANLMLGRTLSRTREIMVRSALGAERWRIVRQLLAESVLLSAAGGLLGWWIAKGAVQLYIGAARGPGLYPWRVLDYSMDGSVVAYIIAISGVSAILFGLAPALRLSSLDVSAALKDGGRGASSGPGARRLTGVLIGVEIALAVVLLAGAGAMIQSLLRISGADIGVTAGEILTAHVSLPAAKYPAAEHQNSFYDRMKMRVGALPGVQSVTLASALPTYGSGRYGYEVERSEPVSSQLRPVVAEVTVDDGYFRTVGARMLSGREFEGTDTAAHSPVAIVNQQFASLAWPDGKALGKRLRLFSGRTARDWVTVVGVASNIVQNDARRQEFSPLVYLPYRQRRPAPADARTNSMDLLVRTSVPPSSLIASLRQQLRELDEDVPAYGPFTLSERLRGTYSDSALYSGLFVSFAAVALLLASAGIYAVVRHSVTQRRQEFGIRLAIGANEAAIYRLILRQVGLPLGVGLIAGLVASAAVNALMKPVLVRVPPADPVIMALVTVVLLASALIAGWLPARQALRMDPAITLKCQ